MTTIWTPNKAVLSGLVFALTSCAGTFIPVKPPATTTVVDADTASPDGGASGTTAPDSGGTDGGGSDDGGSDDGGSGSGEDTAGGDSGSGEDTAGGDVGGDAGGETGTTEDGIVGTEVPDFSLEDVNETSSTWGQPVSPRDLLAQTSGWYFTHAT